MRPDRVPTRSRIPLAPYPRGWYAVALSRELEPGQVLPRQLCGREIAVGRRASGEAFVSDAECPHLGAHLGHGGRIDGETLVCPLHGWRIAPDGGCSSPRHGPPVPPNARLRLWPACEQDDVILAYFAVESGDSVEKAAKADDWQLLPPDPELLPPDWELPRFEFGPAFTATRSRLWEIATHPQEILENGVDGAHFSRIHGMHVLESDEGPQAEGPLMRIVLDSNPTALEEAARLPEATPLAHNEVGFHGPGITFSRMRTGAAPLRVLSRVYVSPIDGERVAMRVLANLLDERPGESANAGELEAIADDVAAEVFRQFDLDVAIWEHKAYRERPALNECEGAVSVFRRWYQQFY